MSDTLRQVASAPRPAGGDTANSCTRSASELADLVAKGAITARETVEAFIAKRTAATMRYFASGSASDYWRATERVMEFQAGFRGALDRAAGGPIDLVLMPANAVPAIPHRATINMPFAGSYALFSPILGYPAGVVPLTRVRPDEEAGRRKSFDVVERTAFETDRGSAGLPVGVQLMGRPWRDDVVLAAMRAIERAARNRADFPLAPKL
jgi:fatty acid amide hydrolase